MAQWLQLYGFSSEELAIALKTFHSAFNHMAVFHPPGGGELIVLGSNLPLDRQRLKEAFTGPGRKLLARAGVGSYEMLNAGFLLEGQALEQWLARNASNLPLNEDDNPVLEYGALRFKQSSGETMLAQNLAMLPSSPQPPRADLNMCNEEIGKDPCAYSYLTSRASIYLLDSKIDKALADLRESIALYPDSAKSHELNAIALIFAGKLDLALEEAQAAHDLDRTSYIPYSLAAIAYRCQGNSPEARRTSNKARQICPDSEILKHIDEAVQTESESASIGNPGILKSALVRLLNILE